MIDPYTKVVLTIIAAVLVAQNFAGGSRADTAAQKVVICGNGLGSNCVDVGADKGGHYRLRTSVAPN